MYDQQELVKTLELRLFEIITQPVQEIDQPQSDQADVHPIVQSGNYGLNSVIPVLCNEFPAETIENRSTIRDLWLATPLFYRQLIEGTVAVILGTLIGLIIPWLTSGF